jgi:Amidohydrolase family
MQGFAYHLRWRDSIAAGTLLGPTLYVASNLIEGDSAFSEGSLVVRTAHGAARTVAAIAREGYDFVKVYVSLEPVAYDGIVHAARRHALRTVGHVPWKTGMQHALAMKQASIEHAENIYQTWFGSRTDTAGLAAMARATRDAGVAVCPTLTTFRSVVLNARAAAVLDSLSARPEWRYVEPSVLASWQEEARAFPEQNGSRQADFLRRFEGEYAFFKRIVQALKAARVTILAGTDAPSNFELPGEQLIHELQVYQEIGFTPFQALVSATTDAARFLDPHRSFGILAAGQRADLLLLHANPLRDVRNLAARAGVMVRGHWLSDAELRTAMERFATIYASAGWRPEGYEPGDYERLQARLAEELAALSPTGRPGRSGTRGQSSPREPNR